jgi:hypothetical protein
LLSVLLPLPAFAQLANPPDEAPVAPAAPLTPEMTPQQKLEQYRRDQINLLALRADAPSVLAAALMATPDNDDKKRPVALKQPALLKRAQGLGESSPLVWWVTAALECHATPKSCPAVETLQKLEGLDAENAAVWTLAMVRAQQAKDAPAARAALTSAAQSARYNDFFGAVIAAMYDAQHVLPMSNDLLNATRQDASVAGLRLIAAGGVAASLPYPAGAAIAEACSADAAADAAVAADCIELAKKMERSGSLNAQRAGIQLHAALLTPGTDLDAVHERQRTLDWQMQRIGELAAHLANDNRITSLYTQALAESGDESAAVYAVLRSQGVTLEPPHDWQAPASAAPLKP